MAATYLKVCGTCVEKRCRRLWVWKFIETHVIYVSVDESQLGQSPDIIKVGLVSRSTCRATARLLCSHLAPAIT